jgi:hypothetical protein
MICPETTTKIQEVGECDTERYMAIKNIRPPTTDREVLSVAAYILHTEANEGLAMLIAKKMLDSLRITFPLFIDWSHCFHIIPTTKKKEEVECQLGLYEPSTATLDSGFFAPL